MPFTAKHKKQLPDSDVAVTIDPTTNIPKINGHYEIAWQPDSLPGEAMSYGRQWEFLAANEDIVGIEGSKGSGKSDLLIMDCLRPEKIANPQWKGVIFRREYKRLMELIDRATYWFKRMPHWRASWQGQYSRFMFPSGAWLAFHNCEYEDDVKQYQGWQICDLKFDQLEEFCLTPDHEVLTENGWKRINSIQIGERVMSLNEDRTMSYQVVTGIPAFDFEGILYEHFAKNGTAFCATENHRLVIEKSGSTKYHRNCHGMKDTGWELRAIKDLPEVTLQVRSGMPWESDRIEKINLPLMSGRGFNRNQNQSNIFSGDDYFEFMGWYLSEGSCYESPDSERTRRYGTSPRVIISQTRHNASLDSLMNRIPFKVTRSYNKEDYLIFSRQLFNHLKPLGNTYAKRIPRWMLNSSPEQLRILFDSFVAGDGHVNRGAIYIGLANEGLIDDLQEICVKLGMVSTKSKGTAYLEKYKKYYDVWRLSVQKKHKYGYNLHKKNIKPVFYKGVVYCLTVPPNQNFMTRYRGRIFWSGNSEKQFNFLSLQNRSGDPLHLNSTIRWTANPVGVGRDWVKKRFIDDKIPGQTYTTTVEVNGELLVKTYKRIFATVFDNPVLSRDKKYIATLASEPNPYLRKALFEGSWDSVIGMFFTEFARDLHVIPSIDLDPKFRRLAGCDYGNYKAIEFLARDYVGNVYVEWEYYSKPSETRPQGETAEEFAEHSAKFMIQRGIGEGLRIIGDTNMWSAVGRDVGTEKTPARIIQDVWNKHFKEAGKKYPPYLVVVSKRSTEEYRYRIACNEAIRTFLHYEIDAQGNIIKGKEPRLYFLNRCEGVINQISSLITDESDPMDIDSSQEDHALDSLKMALMELRNATPEVPVDYPKTEHEYLEKYVFKPRYNRLFNPVRSWDKR